MDPSLISAPQWQALAQVVLAVVVFVALTINAAFALLTGHAIVPSLLHSEDVPANARLVRWALYPVFAISLVLALIALARALSTGVAFLNDFYPRYEY